MCIGTVGRVARGTSCVLEALLRGCWSGCCTSRRNSRSSRWSWPTRQLECACCRSADDARSRVATQNGYILMTSRSPGPKIFSACGALLGRLRRAGTGPTAGSRPLTRVRMVRLPVGVRASTWQPSGTAPVAVMDRASRLERPQCRTGRKHPGCPPTRGSTALAVGPRGVTGTDTCAPAQSAARVPHDRSPHLGPNQT